jgi:hypothetical protein
MAFHGELGPSTVARDVGGDAVTWKEFKEWAEANGVRDDDKIEYVDISHPFRDDRGVWRHAGGSPMDVNRTDAGFGTVVIA